MARRGDATETAATYRHYFEAFRVYCRHAGYAELPEVSQCQLHLPWFRSAQRDASVSPELKKHLFRGWLTKRTMHEFGVENTLDLAICASMWLPVQAYYSCHGVGIAALYALRCTMPAESHLTHRGFRRAASDRIFKPGMVLPPFDLRCDGDCTSGRQALLGTTVTTDQVREASNLRRPRDLHSAEVLIAKSVKTTREKAIEELFAKNRAKPRQRLSRDVKERVVANLHVTSCLDFVYRMRINSNYDDADMFLFGQDRDSALVYSADVTWLAESVCAQLENIIQHKIGDRAFAALEAEFDAAIRAKR